MTSLVPVGAAAAAPLASPQCMLCSGAGNRMLETLCIMDSELMSHGARAPTARTKQNASWSLPPKGQDMHPLLRTKDSDLAYVTQY